MITWSFFSQRNLDRFCLAVFRIGCGMLCLSMTMGSAVAQDLYERVEHHYVENNGVRIHYASLGQGPLVGMIHGFPDFWYTWRHQMAGLSSEYRVVAVDLRGYNLSDKPDGVDAYALPNHIADVAAVIRDTGEDSAVIVGHDWGGMVAWYFAMTQPTLTDKLVILNLPHPNGLSRELVTNPQQYENSAYARTFQEKSPADPDVLFGRPMTAETLAFWVTDPAARQRYVEAFQRSDFTGMLNMYKANYPRVAPGDEVPPPAPPVTMPVLMFHGLDDTALLSGALNNTWDWLEQDLTLVTVPGVGHFVQQDASELVTSTMQWWLGR